MYINSQQSYLSQINTRQTNVCIFSPPNNKYQVNKCIKINNENINYIGKDKKEESVKFLGIYIDKPLTMEKTYKYNQF